MDFSTLPPYRGPSDDGPSPARDRHDRSVAETAGLVLAAVLALIAGTAVASLVVVRLVAAPAG